jgi:hypothetical protein
MEDILTLICKVITVNITIVKMVTVSFLNLMNKILLQLLSAQIKHVKLVTMQIICLNLEKMTFIYRIIVTIIFPAIVT